MRRLGKVFIKPQWLTFKEGSSLIEPEDSLLLQNYVRKHYTGKRQSILVTGHSAAGEPEGLADERAIETGTLLFNMGIPEKDILIRSSKPRRSDEPVRDEDRTVSVRVEPLAGKLMRHGDKIVIGFFALFILVNILYRAMRPKEAKPFGERATVEAVAAALSAAGVEADSVTVTGMEPISNYEMRSGLKGLEAELYHDMFNELRRIRRQEERKMHESVAGVIHAADSVLALPVNDEADSIAFRVAVLEKQWAEGMRVADSAAYEAALDGADRHVLAMLSGGDGTDGYRITAEAVVEGRHVRIFLISPADHLNLTLDGVVDVDFLNETADE